MLIDRKKNVLIKCNTRRRHFDARSPEWEFGTPVPRQLGKNTPILGAKEERSRSNLVNISLRENRSRLQSRWRPQTWSDIVGTIDVIRKLAEETGMRSLISGGALAVLLMLAGPTEAEDLASSIVGVWKVTSFTSKVVDGGEIRRVYGTQPGGYVIYTRGGHAVLILVGDNRKAPAAAGLTDAERAELFKSLAAWSGTYKVEGAKVIVHVDASWNQSWTGTDLVRSVEIDGKKMTNSFATKSVLDGKEVLNTVTYERVE